MSERESANPERPGVRSLRLLGVVAITLAVLVGIVRVTGVAEGLAYVPSRQPFVTPPGFEDVWFESSDGVKLHAWFMPAVAAPGKAESASPGPAVLHAHGNAGTLADHRSFSEFLTRAGFHVFLFDYRGYGRSDEAGPLRRGKLLLDTQAAMDALAARPEVDPGRIGVMGVSLGGVFTSSLAAQDDRVRALVLVSAFSSWHGVAGDWLPVIGPLLIPSGLDPKIQVAKLGGRPLLIVHGQADEIIDIRHASVLKEAAESASVPVRLRAVPGGDHNSLLQSDPSSREAIVDFFRAGLAPANAVDTDVPPSGG